MKQKILALDASFPSLENIVKSFKNGGFNVYGAFGLEEAKQKLAEKSPHFVAVGGSFIEKMGNNILKKLKEAAPGVSGFVLHAAPVNQDLRQALDSTGYERVENIDQLVDRLSRWPDGLPVSGEPEADFQIDADFMRGENLAAREIQDNLMAAAKSEAPVFLTGETGTGKGLAARFIHQNSARAGRKYLAVHCAGLADEFVEREWFGSENGAEGRSQAPGLFERAEGGTLFLDGIGELSLDMQAKLLRALEDREFQRPGGRRTVKVECRIVTASAVNLKTALEAGRLRPDLFFRLNAATIHLPPLRERREDVLFLANVFLKDAAGDHGKRADKFSSEAEEKLLRYPWPGNVRQLKHAVEQAVLACKGKVVEKIPPASMNLGGESLSYALPENMESMTLRDFRDRTLEQGERVYLQRLLERHRGHVSNSAQAAGVDRKTFYRKIRQYDIDPKDFKNKIGKK